jgi:hypothetical protein
MSRAKAGLVFSGFPTTGSGDQRLEKAFGSPVFVP